MFRRPRAWFAASGLLLVIAGVAAWFVYQHHRYKHVAVHEPEMVYRSAWVAPDVFAELIEEYQIRTVVNLCESDEMSPEDWSGERRAVEAAGARFVSIRMPMSITLTDREIGQHLEIMRDPDNYPLLVHCQHGVTRTAKFLAMYDIAFRKMSARASLAAQPKFGRDDHNVHVRAFARDFEVQHRELYQAAVPQRLDVLRD